MFLQDVYPSQNRDRVNQRDADVQTIRVLCVIRVSIRQTKESQNPAWYLITTLAFSPNGSRLIVGTYYNDTAYNVQVYDGNTFEYLHGRDYTDSGQRDNISAVATRKGWYEAAIGGAFNKVYLYNTKSDFTLKTFNTSSIINDLAYRPDGDRLAAAGTDGVHIFYTDHKNGTRRLLRTLRAHTGAVFGVAWSPNGSRLATGGEDGTVRLWNPDSGVNYAVLRGHTEAVLSGAFSPDGRNLASGSQDDSVRIWDVNTQRHLRRIYIGSDVSGVVFHPSKQILAVAAVGGVRLYNPGTGNLVQSLPKVSSNLAFHPNGKFLATVGINNRSYSAVEIWGLVTANRLDVNKDGRVNINDLIEVARNYGKTGTNNADVNNDKRVDVKDFIAVAKAVNPLSLHLPLESNNLISRSPRSRSNNGFKTRKSKALMPRASLPWSSFYKLSYSKQKHHRRKPRFWQTTPTRSTQRHGYRIS